MLNARWEGGFPGKSMTPSTVVTGCWDWVQVDGWCSKDRTAEDWSGKEGTLTIINAS